MCDVGKCGEACSTGTGQHGACGDGPGPRGSCGVCMPVTPATCTGPEACNKQCSNPEGYQGWGTCLASLDDPKNCNACAADPQPQTRVCIVNDVLNLCAASTCSNPLSPLRGGCLDPPQPPKGASPWTPPVLRPPDTSQADKSKLDWEACNIVWVDGQGPDGGWGPVVGLSDCGDVYGETRCVDVPAGTTLRVRYKSGWEDTTMTPFGDMAWLKHVCQADPPPDPPSEEISVPLVGPDKTLEIKYTTVWNQSCVSSTFLWDVGVVDGSTPGRSCGPLQKTK